MERINAIMELCMGFNDTITQLGTLLSKTVSDLSKVHKGNKSAAQRVRVSTINIEKIAKKFRKESVILEKKSLSKKRGMMRRKKMKKVPRKSRPRFSL